MPPTPADQSVVDPAPVATPSEGDRASLPGEPTEGALLAEIRILGIARPFLADEFEVHEHYVAVVGRWRHFEPVPDAEGNGYHRAEVYTEPESRIWPWHRVESMEVTREASPTPGPGDGGDS